MRHLSLAAIALLVLPPAIASAATPSWGLATSTSVLAGVASRSTFVIQAYVTLPNQCYMTRIRSTGLQMNGHRSFVVEQMAPSTACKQTAQHSCTVVSSAFNLPIPHTFEVDTNEKNWKVQLAMERPTPVQPICKS
ncbi:MAG: hypothetical protein WA814_05545 [Candidatus Baltobacteraceae bacterium]